MALTINGHVVSMGGKIWETRESADSPPCNCRQFFFDHVGHEMLKTLKTMCFLHVSYCFIFGRHLQSIIFCYVGQFKIQKMWFR